jgi:hypothetical protein
MMFSSRVDGSTGRLFRSRGREGTDSNRGRTPNRYDWRVGLERELCTNVMKGSRCVYALARWKART